MARAIGIELFGPASDEDGLRPVLGDTVAVVTESGRVQFVTISGTGYVVDGMVLYASNGQRLTPSDCYFVYTVDEGSVE